MVDPSRPDRADVAIPEGPSGAEAVERIDGPGDALTAVWANDGGDKVARGEMPAADGSARLANPVWDGDTVRLASARNEVLGFALILEAADGAAGSVDVSFDRLDGPDGSSITGAPADPDALFDWTERDIELFYVRYLEILGLSELSYWDAPAEAPVPERFQLPIDDAGEGDGSWEDRADAGAAYPDLAVPLELERDFTVPAASSQTVWVDIYVPKDVSAGDYVGTITVTQAGEAVFEVPVELTVWDFELPDDPVADTMLYLGNEEVNGRYLGQPYPDGDDLLAAAELLRDRHFMVAHRHKISLITGPDLEDEADQPPPEWLPRLDGTLFTAENGYAGPGVGVPNDVYSVGTYGAWSWMEGDRDDMWEHTDAWVRWFEENAPETFYFLYLTDEPPEESEEEDEADYERVEEWAQWVDDNPGPGSRMPTFVTMDHIAAAEEVPSLDIPAAWGPQFPVDDWEEVAEEFVANDRPFVLYNGRRPGSGSFATEDDGVALRQLPWAQFKKGVDRWFFWESAFYTDIQCCDEPSSNNVFATAKTIGEVEGDNGSGGEGGYLYSNGDGVLFYPGTDWVFEDESYGIDGPIASLRLKHWRRGIQDVDYLALAAEIDPDRVRDLVDEMVPEVLWEVDLDFDSDFVDYPEISWSTDPADWETARAELAEIIQSGS